MTPREYYALRDVWELPYERNMEMWAGLMCKMHNMWRGEGPAVKPSDFYKPKRGRKVDRTKLADPLDPNGTQTVQEKMFMMRSILAEAAENLPASRIVPSGEMSEAQRAAVEAAWADFQNVTGQKPN